MPQISDLQKMHFELNELIFLT